MIKGMRTAADDIWQALVKTQLAFLLGARDALSAYRMAVLGPVWIIVQVALWVAMLSYVFMPSLGGGRIDYVVFVAAGYVFFQFCSNMVNDGVMAYRRDAGILLNIPQPTFLSILKVFFKSLTLLFVHISVLIFVYFMFSEQHVFPVWSFVAGFALLSLTLVGAALLLANVCLLIPDLGFLTQAVMRILFFGTPIIWRVEQREGLRRMIAEVNPLTHLIELVRASVLGATPDATTWIVSAATCATVWFLGFLIFSALRPRLVARL